ncbi:MAG: sugar phosphate isomerase/epimerase family protein [Nitrospirota bacterium]
MIRPDVPVIGASRFTEYDGSFLDFARAAAGAGFRLVELKIEPVPRRTSGPEEEALRALARKEGIAFTVHAPYLSVNIGDLDDELFEEAKRAYADARSFAARIEARTVTFHAGKISREAWLPKTWDICRKRSIQGIAGILDSAPSSAPQAAVENLGQFTLEYVKYGVTVPELLDIRRALGGRTGFTLDLGHLRSCRISPLTAARALGPETIFQAHLHSNGGDRDDHGPLSEHDGDLTAFLDAYARNGWTFPLTVEVRRWEDLIASRDVLFRFFRRTPPGAAEGREPIAGTDSPSGIVAPGKTAKSTVRDRRLGGQTAVQHPSD